MREKKGILDSVIDYPIGNLVKNRHLKNVYLFGGSGYPPPKLTRREREAQDETWRLIVNPVASRDPDVKIPSVDDMPDGREKDAAKYIVRK